MYKRTITAVSCALVLSMSLGGCFFFKRGSDEPKEPETEAPAADTRRVIGDTSAAAAYEVPLVNAIEAPIETLSLRPVGTLEYGADLLGGAPINAGEEVVLRVAQEGAPVAYDVRATCAGGAVVHEFVGVPVQGVTQVFLHVEGAAPYVDYISTDGVVSSTKDYLVAQSAPAPVEA